MYVYYMYVHFYIFEHVNYTHIMFFQRLLQDHDRRVREATQQAFEQLILKVRKHLAPHLKSLMGHWLIAQCDVYSPAASASKVAFEKAFPPSKQPEALVFCKDEILIVSFPVCVNVLKF